MFERHFGEGNLLLPGPDHIFEFDAFMAEKQHRDFVHAMAVQPRFEIETHDDRVIDWRKHDVMLAEHAHIIFEIVANFEDGRVFE